MAVKRAGAGAPGADGGQLHVGAALRVADGEEDALALD